ncbi:hypothetical protein FAZ95_13795 [Trinickia violacea]|uniref:Phage tail assembly protein n=1 Tax=Trinickia violacea TaxID=2571746 RepID=A0A4P8IPF9_9BURK|nr:hypothetical protein [Trinickia violacea]QCP50156.1 hypothetical protein FAZ95_13795 [Trinickia violacea]
MSETKQGTMVDESGEVIVPLSKPLIDQEGKSHDKLVLKDPDTTTFVKIGDPFRMVPVDDGRSSSVELNRDRLLSYVSAVTGIHRPLLLTMSRKDISAVTDKMFSFFG